MRTSGWLVTVRRLVVRRNVGRTGGVTRSDRSRNHRVRPRIIWSTVALSLLAFALCSGLALAAGGTSDSSASSNGGDPQSVSGAASGAESTPPPFRPSGTAEGPQVTRGRELPGKRTATSRTFELSDGARETRIYQTPVNYRDAKGGWQPIGQGLRREAGAITNGANRFQVTLPDELGAAPLRFSVGEDWISERPTSIATGPASLGSGVATYGASASGPSLHFSGLPDGVEEDIELPGPSAPSTYRFELQMSKGLTPSLTKEGSVEIAGPSGGEVAEIPAPVMFDSAAVPQSSHAVHYALEPASEGRWTLVVEADPEWLARPGLDWPVELDPTITIPRDEIDCNIFNGPYSEYNTCGTSGFPYLATFGKYKSSGEDEYSRSLLRFDLHSIPTGASVYSATLGLYGTMAPHNTQGVEGWALSKPWTSAVNWHHYASGLPWEHEGGDYSQPNFALHSSEAPAGAGWWKFTGQKVQWTVEQWLHGKLPDDGFLLKLIDERTHECSPTCTERYVEWSSSQVYETERPYLAVSYYMPAPGESRLTSPMEGTHSASRFKLQAGWAEHTTGVTGVLFQYQGSEGWETVPTAHVTTEGGAPVEWPFPVKSGTRKSEPVYWDALADVNPAYGPGQIKAHVRAVLVGTEGGEGFTEPAEVVLDRELGGPKDATAQVGPGTVDLLTGNLDVSHTDVRLPGFGSALEFSRSFNSQKPKAEEKGGVLGPGWVPGISIEEEGGSAWRNLVEETFMETWEEEVCVAYCNEEGEEEEEWISVPKSQTYEWAQLTTVAGEQIAFERQGTTYVTPPELTGWSLVASGPKLVLSEPGGDQTTFENLGEGNEYVPGLFSQTGGPGNQAQLVWKPREGKKRLVGIVAPTAEGVTCEPEKAAGTPGCHSLSFTYQTAAELHLEAGVGERLTGITYWSATGPSTMGHWEVAHYVYNPAGRLVEEWDPRLTTPLRESYTYDSAGHLHTVTPPGLDPWTLEYGTVEGESPGGRLVSVQRASLISSPTTAQTTITYRVPLSGTGAPYEMGPSTVRQWGQTDAPQDATAIFPPDQVPASPPTSYSHATVYYMDVEGHLVNTATPSGAGTSNPSISTTETDEFGNVVREVTPQNRLRILEKPEAERAKAAEELETRSVYSADGTEMLEEKGPVHQVRLESGVSTKARSYEAVEYDQGMPVGESPVPHVPTTETTGALVGGTLDDQRVTKTGYDWVLREPDETVVDPGTGHLNLVSKVLYNDTSGLPTERLQPAYAEGKKGSSTKTTYYTAGASGECVSTIWANLPCRVEPVAQPGTTGQPAILVTRYTSYDELDEPTETVESPGGEAGNTRKTVSEYDAVGRPVSRKIEGGGTAVPKTETLYSPTTGLPEKQQFACGTECGAKISYSSSFGSSGTGNGQFAHPGDVALDPKGDLWVADDNNNRLEEFNEKGEYLKSVGSYGTGNGQFHVPKSIAFTAAGNFWVADSGNSRLEEFNEKGEFLKAVGSAGSGNGQFNGPEGIAIDAKGDIWVSDTYNHRIQELNEKGEFIKVVNPSGLGAIEPTGITVSGGDVWVTDWSHNRVVEIGESGETLVRQFGSEGTGNGQFKHPDAVAIDSSGDVWIGDQNNERVQEFNQKGEYVAQFGSSGSGSGQFTLSYPMGIAADTKGDLWVTDTNDNRVERWTVSAGVNREATTATYNALGQVTEYEDADGNKAKTTYDVDGRPVTMTDGKGSQTVTYDPTSGLPTRLEDSAAGTFTASYDADGNMVERTLPNGITAKTTYNEVDEPTKLAYTKTSSCGASCTWLEEGVERSIYGQIMSDTGNLVSDLYSYDKAGRLTEARETPTGGGCTTRAYTFDSDSNRLTKTTREPGVGGACVTSGGTPQKYEYDAADRLLGEGLTYDNFGRITNLPAADAGGHALVTAFYSTNMVARQEQNGIANSYELDATGRQRARLQGGGGLEGTEVFHYDGPSDSPAWTERGSTWTRYITGIGGELAAIQESGGGVTFQLTDLHGDVVAAAESSPTATKLKATYRFDEFGEPVSGTAGRFGWLGGKSRRTELSSGVIQMGARSYVSSLGRFLTPDPIPGGSANPYDYANQDPVNGFDLEGTCSTKKKCAAVRKKVNAAGNKLINHVRAVMKQAREARTAAAARASSTDIGGVIPITVPWEHEVNEALSTAQHAIASVFGSTCVDAGGALGAAALSATETGRSLMTGEAAESSVGATLSGLGRLMAWASAGFYIAHTLKVC
jgi:RHS repeat-associated protein